MPRRNDIRKILFIGSGPIIIGQACEFDYSGTQACKALREEGYEVVLVNSNPATIMTDPGVADRTYIEPLTWETVAKVIEKERPDAILPTLGGQTGLNLSMDLWRNGILKKFNVEMIGADAEVIAKAEDRDLYKQAMERIGIEVCKGKTVKNLADARNFLPEIGLPCIIRPSYTLGGTGSAIAHNMEEFDQKVQHGLDESPVHEVLIEESVLGWKEIEMELIRDMDDNIIVVCSIENVDAMGVHTGDSITVAPAQTLTLPEYQQVRDASVRMMREIGVKSGGSNMQFAIHPTNGRLVAIEMNPRVSRSSALASKATGIPIARISTKLAVGYRLPELMNDITGCTTSFFEPTIDYVVTKVPRFTFEKFPEANDELTTQMKSVGETMAIGRTFRESLQKAMRGLEVGCNGLGSDPRDFWDTRNRPNIDDVRQKLSRPNAWRISYLRYAVKHGMTVDEIYQLSAIDPFFIQQIVDIVRKEEELAACGTLDNVSDHLLKEAKQYGFSDRQLATILGSTEMTVRENRKKRGIVATFKAIDTCAAEFEAVRPYYYSTYGDEDETPAATDKRRIVILGGGPNRIGQGIEFDYCCCHASFVLRDMGIESIMINSNPETVSTDYDTSDILFFEPLTTEDVLNVCDRIHPDGMIVQFGGQTPLNLARGLADAGVPIIGTSVDTIDDAEDRERFIKILEAADLRQPANGIAHSIPEAQAIADKVGYPCLVRPSFVLGGRGMEICYDNRQLDKYIAEAFAVAAGRPVLIDRFLEDAVEVDVDAICDGTDVIVAGVLEHIEAAGIHSGDSACTLPPQKMATEVIEEIKTATRLLAKNLNVRGLMNIQFAVKEENGKPVVYILEVNPRASRTVPFVSKAVGLPLAQIAAKVMAGVSLREQGITEDPKPRRISVKEAVFPFAKFAGVDTVLGPEMKSTGEVMGISPDFAIAFAKSQFAAGNRLPTSGKIFISVDERAKESIVPIARRLEALGFELLATPGTGKVLEDAGIFITTLKKVQEGHPNVLDYMLNGDLHLIINTPSGKGARTDEGRIRAAAVTHAIPYLTTIPAAEAGAMAIEAMQLGDFDVEAVQDRFPESDII